MSYTDLVGALSGTFAGLAVVFGVVAAILWYRSATHGLKAQQIREFLSEPAKHGELASWLAESSDLNKWASIWTAISVLAGALSTALEHMH